MNYGRILICPFLAHCWTRAVAQAVWRSLCKEKPFLLWWPIYLARCSQKSTQKMAYALFAHRKTSVPRCFLCARIVMVDALHHVCDQRATAQELWRILRPGGRLVIEEPDLRTFTVKLLALAEKLALMRSHFLAPPQIAQLFPYPEAQVQIETGKFNAWVIVDKNEL